MFDRANTLRRLGLACLVVTLGCKPDPVTTDPEPKPDAGGPPTAAASDTQDDAGAGEDGDADAGDADPEDGPTVPDGEDGSDADDGGDAEPDDPEQATATVSAPVADAGGEKGDAEKEPLPKPTYELKGKTCQASFNVGNKIKGFQLPSVDGKKKISPNNYRKRVMLLNFWGTWCKPCLKELPEFDRLYRKYRKHGLTLVAVATDEDAEPVQAFIDKHKLRAKVALEGEEVAGAYNRPNFPFSFVVDGTGTIIAAYEYIDDACMGDLEQVIRDELEKL